MHQFMPAACALACALTPAVLAFVPSYTLTGSFALEGQRWDTLSDGRLITIDAQGVIRTQDTANAASFTAVGSIDASLLNSFGSSFISVSPDGSTVAIGDGNFGGASVYTIQTTSLTTAGNSAVTGFSVGSYDAEWIDNTTLAIAGADNDSFASVVTQLNVTNGDTQILVNDIGGASGGIAINNGFLYTGNGFQFSGPSGTGEVRAFALADLASSTLSFETQGIAVADALSAATLDFDASGNMLLGGGDFSIGDTGYAAVIDRDDIDAAFLGGPLAAAALQLAPDPNESFNLVRFNDATGEVLVQAQGVIYRYQVPAPGAAALALTAAAAIRRRRNA